MPMWLAIAIPSVIAVAACLMWALDYTKRVQEIAKLRLELEKLTRERDRANREDSSRAAGLYEPTTAEIEKYGTPRPILPPPGHYTSGGGSAQGRLGFAVVVYATGCVTLALLAVCLLGMIVAFGIDWLS